jgi:glycosyltransferase involved in cell wall biosynthesis
MAMIAGEVSGVPWSLTAHRGDIAENNLLALKTAKAAFVRFISASGAEMAATVAPGLPRGKGAVIHVGVAMDAAGHVAPKADRPPILLCPANLVPVKGHKHLIRAMAILKGRGVSCSLRFAGEGELREELAALTRELACTECVRFLGHVRHETILQWYANRDVDAVVLPSVDLGNNLHEGIPVSLMEAMAHGIPVVATSTGGIPELLGGGAGLIVPPQDPAALADAIERLAENPALQEELGQAGRVRIEEEFNVQSAVAQLLDAMAKSEFE